ncbi:MAG: isoprenyl transferase [Kiritimatiellia bacterium]
MSSQPKIPQHVAIIMDGNGRWARQRGLPRIKGHEEGAKSVLAVIRACRNWGIKFLTLYAFSSENWRRPRSEIRGLMELLVQFLREHEAELYKHGIRLRIIGRLEDFPLRIQRELCRVVAATQQYQKAQLILALSYGGRAEIVRAARRLAEQVHSGKLRPDEITEAAFAAGLDAPDVPDPDLLIRTSGEMRVSNFLLWQISYTEFYVTKTLWPDFRERQFAAAIREYGRRQRRFGGLEDDEE